MLVKMMTAMCIAIALWANSSLALDVVKVPNFSKNPDKRNLHKDEVIIRALEATVEEFGDYRYERVDFFMPQARAFSEIQTGNVANLYITAANESWDKKAIPVKIPIRMGLLSYRLLLVNQKDLDKFNGVTTYNAFAKIKAGLKHDWITTGLYQSLNLNFTIGHSFEGLFLMLDKRRFDYIPRAIYEIYDELENRKSTLKNVMVEPNLALFIPMVSYAYISPDSPRIAQRIESGLTKMLKSGELKDLLDKYYAEDIARANLNERTIIQLSNPYLIESGIMEKSELWYPLKQ